MSDKKETPQQRWDRKNEYITKGFKMRKPLADEFKEVCDEMGVSQSSQIIKFMEDFIRNNKKRNTGEKNLC